MTLTDEIVLAMEDPRTAVQVARDLGRQWTQIRHALGEHPSLFERVGPRQRGAIWRLTADGRELLEDLREPYHNRGRK